MKNIRLLLCIVLLMACIVPIHAAENADEKKE